MIENELNVWFADKHVGCLWPDDNNTICFQYTDDWVDYKYAFQISPSLPLTEEPFENDRIAHNFFSNLLPEAKARENICRQNQISIDNDFSLLKAIGGECAGALTISYDKPQIDSSYKKLSNDEFLELLKNKNYKINTNNEDAASRLSLAGAQAKVPLKIEANNYYLPYGTSPSTHILKFDSLELKNIPAFEVVTTWTARNLGLNTIEIDYHVFKTEKFSITKRYDRIIKDNDINRIHQEDFCQALGLSSEKKYEREGGPTFAQCYQLVSDKSSRSIVDKKILLEWLVINYLIGNCDSHAKNLSFIREGDSYQLSPIYDLVCTQAYPPNIISKYLAMSIGGKFDPKEVTLNSWKQLESDCGLKEGTIIKILNKKSKEAIPAFVKAKKEFEEQYGQYEALNRVGEAIIKTVRYVKNITNI